MIYVFAVTEHVKLRNIERNRAFQSNRLFDSFNSWKIFSYNLQTRINYFQLLKFKKRIPDSQILSPVNVSNFIIFLFAKI